MEIIYNKEILDVSNHNLYKYFDNIYDVIIEDYKESYKESDYTNGYFFFIKEYFKVIKYNSNFNLCILKKNFLGIEKDTCVVMTNEYFNYIIIFYLKDDNKNVELATELWLDNINCGNFEKKSTYNNIIINNKEKYIAKEIELKSEIEIVVQEKLTIIEK